jgi:hypothetical protein
MVPRLVVASDQPVEQHPHRRQLLLDPGRPMISSARESLWTATVDCNADVGLGRNETSNSSG